MTIKEFRLDLSLSQEALARKLDISTACVRKWEKGLTNPNKTQRCKLYTFCEMNGYEYGENIYKKTV